jgi:hypothetical protein
LSEKRGKYMPRPLIRPTEQIETHSVLSLSPITDLTINLTDEAKMKLARLLRKPRSAHYMDTMKKLDVGGHVHNKAQTDDIINALRAEFPEIEMEGILLGVVAKCYLGDTYEVHSYDASGGIIKHFRQREAMPGGLEKARSLAAGGHYEFVEVYFDCLRAIGPGGEVSVIEI